MLPATSWNGRWDDGWFTQDEEGCWWSHAETQLWLDIEEVMGLDEKTGPELAEQSFMVKTSGGLFWSRDRW